MYILEPGSFRYGLQRGMQGTDVAALQLNIGVATDGRFGKLTEESVRYWQDRKHLVVDGKVGPKTFQSLVVELSTPAARAYGLPVGMAKSIAFAESGFVIGSSGKHGGDEGYDVGCYALSSGTKAGSQDFYYSAFNVTKAADVTCKLLSDFRSDILDFEPVPSSYMEDLTDGNPVEFKWVMAVLSHNWPYAALQIPRTGHIYVDANRDDQPELWIEQASSHTLHTPREWVYNYVRKSTIFVDFT